MSRKVITQKIDIKGWKTIIKELQRIKGGSYKDIIKAEAGEVLRQTTNRKSTKLARHEAIVNYLMPWGSPFGGYMGKKKGYTLKSGEAGVSRQTTYLLTHRLPNNIWNYIVQKQTKKVQNPYDNVGMNKGQFAYMAKLLRLPNGTNGFDGSANKYIQKSPDEVKENTFAKERGKKDSQYSILVGSNLSKVLRFGRGASNFKSVMKGRARKMERALAKGILNDIKKRTRAYPMIFKK
nr:hypothetical protein [uncultured Mediterranean phage uvMED]